MGKGYLASGLCQGCYSADRVERGAKVLKQVMDIPLSEKPLHAKPLPMDDPWQLEPGKPCPACGKPVGMTPAEKQRRYRERKRNG